MPLDEVHRILIEKREFMFSFMDRYLFSRANVQRNNILNTQQNFINVIKFCINTRQRTVNIQRENAINYFTFHYNSIRLAIKQGNWELLKDIIYLNHKNEEYMNENGLNYPIGVGQKIGSFILEVLIHYGEANPDLESELFVPMDTHVNHILSECLGVNNINSLNITTPVFINLQNFLSENIYDNNPRIYFDYLWFIGKMFCTQRQNGNGFRLCNICWIRDNCIYANRWFT